MTDDTKGSADASPRLTVVVTTFNRKDELGRCLTAVLNQDYPCELLVLDDASSDGTADYVRSAFPQVRLECSQVNVGLIGQRTRSGLLASGEFMLSIDDDIILDAPDTLRRVVAAFDRPDIAAVTVPSIDILKNPDHIHHQPPDHQQRYMTANYRGGATAFRCEVFNALGGYDARLYRQGEEMDLAIRLYSAGYIIVMGDIPPILHYESPRRIHAQIFYYNARNTILFCWRRVPWRHLPMYLCIRTWHLLKHAVCHKQLGATMRGLLAGQWMGIVMLRERAAASPGAFVKFERLRRGGPMPLNTMEPANSGKN